MHADVGVLASKQFGLITWSQLLAHGMTPSAIGRAARGGRLRPVHRAVYALPGVPETFEQLALAAQFAGDAAVSHDAAAKLWGIEGMAPDRPVLLIPHERRLSIPGVSVHRSSNLAKGDVVRRGVFRLTSGTRTLIDLASILPRLDLEHALDDALRRGLTSVSSLTNRLAKIDRSAGGVALRRLLDVRDGRRPAGSTLQTMVRRTLRGLPQPVEEYEVHGWDGKLIARVDMAYPERKIAIEVDGWRYHSGRERWELDAVRQNRLVLEGWTPLRFTSTALRDGSARKTVERLLLGA